MSNDHLWKSKKLGLKDLLFTLVVLFCFVLFDRFRLVLLLLLQIIGTMLGTKVCLLYYLFLKNQSQGRWFAHELYDILNLKSNGQIIIIIELKGIKPCHKS